MLLTKNMAIDYGRMGIRVNCMCPGFIDTPMFRSVMGLREDGAVPRRVPRAAQARTLRATRTRSRRPSLFLASDDASFVTGHALVVDGGYTTGMRTELSDLMGLRLTRLRRAGAADL